MRFIPLPHFTTRLNHKASLACESLMHRIVSRKDNSCVPILHVSITDVEWAIEMNTGINYLTVQSPGMFVLLNSTIQTGSYSMSNGEFHNFTPTWIGTNIITNSSELIIQTMF